MSDQAGAYPLVPPATGSGDGSFWFPIRVTADTEDVVVGNAVATCHIPGDYVIAEIAAGVTVAPVGSQIQIEVNNNGAQINTDENFIDPGEYWSGDGIEYPFALNGSNTTVNAGATITIDIVTIGSSTPGKGLIVYLKLEPQ